MSEKNIRRAKELGRLIANETNVHIVEFVVGSDGGEREIIVRYVVKGNSLEASCGEETSHNEPLIADLFLDCLRRCHV